MNVDPHFAIEGHLPSICPLSLVDKVIIKKSDFSKLTSESQEKLKELFVEGESLLIGPDDDEAILALASKYLVMEEAPQGKFERGFAFTLEAEFGIDHVLPLAFETPGKGRIDFRVRGQGFRIALLEDQKPLIESNSSEAIIFGIDTLNQGLKTKFFHGYKTQARYTEEDFLWGCDLDAFVHISIEYEAGNGLTVTNKANKRVIKYRDDSTTKLAFVSVSCWRDAVAFKSFFIK